MSEYIFRSTSAKYILRLLYAILIGVATVLSEISSVRRDTPKDVPRQKSCAPSGVWSVREKRRRHGVTLLLKDA